MQVKNWTGDITAVVPGGYVVYVDVSEEGTPEILHAFKIEGKQAKHRTAVVVVVGRRKVGSGTQGKKEDRLVFSIPGIYTEMKRSGTAGAAA